MWRELARWELFYTDKHLHDPSEAQRLGAAFVLSVWPEPNMPSLLQSIARLRGMLFAPTIPGTAMFEVSGVIAAAIVHLEEVRNMTEQN